MSIEKRLDRMIERADDAGDLATDLANFIDDEMESDVEDLLVEISKRLMGNDDTFEAVRDKIGHD